MNFELDSLSAIENFFSAGSSDAICVGDPDALDKFYKRIKDDFNLEELKDILDCDDNMLIVSCAGSGKTTTLILKILRDFLSGKFIKKVILNGIETHTTCNILVSTFLKSGATDLSNRFNELITKYNIKGIDTKCVSFRTIHSEVYSALVKMGVKPIIVQEADTYKFIRQACKDYNIHSLAAGKNKDLTQEEIADIACILTYSRNRLDASKYTHPLMAEYGIDEIELKAVLEEFKQLKAAAGVQDFEDLEEILYDAYGKLPKVVEYIKSRYDFIYLDEFQDTSQLQYAILKPYFESAKGFIAVGDDDQCLCENTEIFTKKGIKYIQDIQKGDAVLTGVGHGEYQYKEVDFITKKIISEPVVTIKTKTGKILKGTQDHIVFTKLPPLENIFEVYLMYRLGIGFRIGQVVGKRKRTKEENIQGISQRLNREKGDKVWVIKQCDTYEEARYWETYYSYKYGIPQYMFKLENQYNNSFNEESLLKLHRELDTYNRGLCLLRDLGMYFDYPHFVPRMKKEKCSLNYTMFMEKGISRQGIHPSELSMTTMNDNFVEIVRPYLNLSKKMPKDRNPYWCMRGSSLDIDLQHSKIENILKEAKNNNIPLTVKKKIKLLKGDSFNFTPIGSVLKGMSIVIFNGKDICEDEVVEVSKEDYTGFVYDISVPETRNFVANSIFVHNCIYSWRGSDVYLIQEQFEKDYHPIVKKLSVNRRCSENILNPIIPSIEKNIGRHKKNLRASKPGGKVEVIVDGGASYLMKAVREDLLKSENVGILGRTNADLLIPALLLELDGYSSFSLSKSVGLTDRIPSQVIGIMDLLTQRYNEKFESYFKLFLTKYNSYEASKLADVLSANESYNIFTIDLRDLEYSAPSLFSILRMIRKTCKYNPDTRQFEGDRVKAYTDLLEIMEQDVYNGKTIYAQRARDFTFYMRKIIQEHEKVKDLTFDELYKLFHTDLAQSLERKKPQKVTRVQKSNGSWVDINPPEDKSFVKITTVHDAKGKQWDNVYIWNDVDGCFPNSVGNRALTEEEFEEERRVHYIAWTRAVKKLTVFTRSDRLDGFIKECDLSEVEIIDIGETKRLTAQNMGKSTKDLLGASKNLHSDKSKAEVVKDWKWYVKEYVKKYTSYSYVCTPKGSNLDICLVKLDGVANLVKKLEEYQLDKYPTEELDGVISDLIESIVNELS